MHNNFNNEFIYPNSIYIFDNWLKLNIKYKHFYDSLNIKLFDVSLRDGLQGIKKENIHQFQLNQKIQIYNQIVNSYKPDYIEIGSIVSDKILPIMLDSVDLYNQFKHYNNNFLLVSSKSKIFIPIQNQCFNISFITSVSETFQLTNTKKTLSQTYQEIIDMIQLIKNNNDNPHIKLYLSCINWCPISGQIPWDFILEQIKMYNDIESIDIICLSDTCGKLTCTDFIELICQMKKFKIPMYKISLHLHIDTYRLDDIQSLFNIALDEGIRHFDTSMLDMGGCSVTMGNNIKPNLSYSLFYKFICDYIIDKCEKFEFQNKYSYNY